MLLNILLGLIGLGFLVVIHEWGHFIAARLCGVQVEAFSVGWGPVLYQREYRGTAYRISAIPLGGYCKMKGAESLQQAIDQKAASVPQETGSFYAASWWQRILILAAGPAVNVLAAILFFFVVYAVGYSYETFPNRVVVADTDTPAAAAGLETGDYILKIQDKAAATFDDIRREIGGNAGRQLRIEYQRNGSRATTTVAPEMVPESGMGRIGIFPFIEPVISDSGLSDYWHSTGLQPGDRLQALNSIEIEHAVAFEQGLRQLTADDLPISLQVERRTGNLEVIISTLPDDPQQLVLPWQTITAESPRAGPIGLAGLAIGETWDTLVLAGRSLRILFSGVEVTQAVSGPVQITHMVGEVATASFASGMQTGIVAVLQFLGLISIILAFMNLLPIPALDGGQIVLAIAGRISPKPLSPRFIARYQNIGALMVLLLIAFAVTSDILFLFQG
ncbi:RIP metalloprotease RseP [Spirochaeta africana]|uniref:Zinc metalloprotease n=1 Tax=Spirochaeta africana (strain ATCC 700263 / DSM 8902 / Z-7692) TaxID=889378 RepID=H9UKJ8_SPIAZ|nr:RIP metalloprotease RseP [Spirochaeta africana]AFG38041.1 RIP metalloprotease RseP [Spirochaeta africana DSM 8902]